MARQICRPGYWVCKGCSSWVCKGCCSRAALRGRTTRRREVYHRAVNLDPNYPGAWAGLAWTHLINARFGWSDSRKASARRAAELAEKTLALDPMRPAAYALLGTIQLMGGNYDEAVALREKAVALSPSGGEVAAPLALTLTYVGEPERSIALLERAMRLSPYPPDWFRWTLGRAYRLAGGYEEAVAALRTRPDESPNSLARRVELAVAVVEMGHAAEARAEATAVLEIDPGFAIGAWMGAFPYRD